MTAVDAQGDSGSAGFLVEVDRGAVGTVESPQATSTLSGTVEVRFAPGSGRTVTGVWVNVVGSLAAAGDGKWRSNWDTTTSLDGPATLETYVSFLDSFGAGRTRRVSVPVGIDNASVRPVVVSPWGWTNRGFSPDGDGSEDTIAGSYCLSEPANVTVSVVPDGGGAPVRTIESDVSKPGAGCSWWSVPTWSWDGLTDSGTVADDGRYRVVLSAIDAQGQSGSSEFLTEVDTAPVGILETPVAGATVSGSVEIVFNPSPGRDVQSVSAPAVMTEGADGKWRGSWDASASLDGAVELGVTVNYPDSFGQWRSKSYRVPVTVDNAATQPVAVTKYGWSDRGFSPNGDGYDENISASYCLSESADVTVTVVPDQGGSPVRTIESDIARFGSPSCYWWNNQSWYWDGLTDSGATAPSGRYRIVVSAKDAQGEVGEAEFRTEARSTPVGSIEAPASGETLAGTVPIRFRPAADVNLVSVTLPSGTPASVQPDGTWAGNWDTTGTADGPASAEVYVTYRDSFGQDRPARAGQPVTIDNASVNPVAISQYGWTNRGFTPDDDGYDEAIAGSYCLSEPASVTVSVIPDGGGTAIRTIETDVARTGGPSCYWWSSQQWGWDGKTNLGTIAPEGRYRVRVSALDAQGDVGQTEFSTEVITSPMGTIEAPTSGANVSGIVELRFRSATGRTVTAASGPSGVLSGPGPDAIWAGDWDTTATADGPTSVDVYVTGVDSFGQSLTARVGTPVTIDNATGRPVEVTKYGWNNRGFTPDGDEYDPSISGSYCLSEPANVTVSVTPEAGGSAVRTIESDVSRPGGPGCFWWNHQQWSWDGLTDAGTVATDGRYRVVVSATDAQNDGSEAVFLTEVHTAPVGAIESPTSGATVAGLARLAFRPSANEQVEQVDFCFTSGQCATGFNSGSDGVWRTSILTGLVPPGPNVVSSQVLTRDSFGTSIWRRVFPSVDVVVDNTAIPLDLTVTPGSGVAPLDTTLTFTTSDPGGQELSYVVNWGDGSPTLSGSVANPYPTVSLAHTYNTPGQYQPRVTVTNGAGGSAQRSAVVVAQTTPNTAPRVTFAAAPGAGSAPLPVTFSATANDPDGDALTYTVDFGDGTQPEAGTGVPPTTVTHTYAGAGTYNARLSVSDGTATTVKVAKVTVGLAEPLSARAGDDRAVLAGDQVTFDGGDSRPSVGITSYEWDFGDGTTATEARTTHAYAQPGTYTARLTVRSGNQSATDTTVVTVTNPPPEPGLRVNITTGGNPLAGAEAIVIRPDGTRLTAVSGTDGRAVLQGLNDGPVTVYVWGDGYQPRAVQATIQGGSGSVDVSLASGEVGAATLESRRLTLEEIIEKGIDVADPENQNVYEATINLFFVPIDEEQPIQEQVRVFVTPEGVSCASDCGGGGGGGWGVGGGFPVFTSGGYRFSPSVQYVEGQPVIQWLVIPVKASWLKEFFDVKLVVQNFTGAFAFTEGTAQLNLPSGLSLAPTAEPQSLQVDVADIAANSSKDVIWTVRGDVEGEYDLSASYSGIVDPIGKPVFLQALTPTPLKVWGGSAVKMIVEVDDKIHRWGPYEIWVTLENVSDIDIYNAEVELKDRPPDAPEWQAEYLIDPLADLTSFTPKLPAHGRFTAKYTVFAGVGNDEVQNLKLVLSQSFIQRTGGNVNIQTELREKTSEVYQAFDNLNVEVDAGEGRGDDRAVLSWVGPAAPDGLTVSGYQVLAGDLRSRAGNWRLIGEVSEDGDGQNEFSVPSTDRSLGRYFIVRTVFSDGSQRVFHNLATGPARYLSLGDSYSSGEGLPAFDVGTASDVTPVPDNLKEQYPYDNKCHRSNGSYGRLISRDDDLPVLMEPAEFHACSGAVTRDFETPNPDNEGEAAQLDHVNEFTDVVTLSVGGNDAGFGDVALMCLAVDCGLTLGPAEVIGSNAWLSRADDMWTAGSFLSTRIKAVVDAFGTCAAAQTPPTAFACTYKTQKAIKGLEELTQFPDAMQRTAKPSFAFRQGALRGRLERIYTQIADRAPNSRVFVQLYPYPVDAVSDGTICNIAPVDGFGLSDTERRAVRKFVDEINARIREAANAANSYAGRQQFRVVDPNPAFAGKELCNGGSLNPQTGLNAIVNPYFSQPGNYGPVAYSLHPNAVGQQAYYQALKSEIDDTFNTKVVTTPESTTQAGTVNVAAGQRYLNVSTYWRGSTVTTTAVGPSGQRVTATTDGVRSDVTPTSEWLDIPNPEPGIWTIEVYGTDVPSDGEDTIVRAWTTPIEIVGPTASGTAAVLDEVTGVVAFDASASEAGDNTIQAYRWILPDGNEVEGAMAMATLGLGPARTALLEVTDASGRVGYADIAIPRFGPENFPPTASDLSTATTVDTPTQIILAGSDPEASALTYEIVSQPGQGTLLGTAPALTYMPAGGFTGTDTFTFRVFDGELWSEPATVTISVTPTTATVAGRALVGGTAVRGAQIRLYLPGSKTPVRYAVSNASGNWTVSGLQPGTYQIQVVPPSRRWQRTWVGPSGDRTTATSYTLTAGQERTGVDVVLKVRG
ncbi:PKD domain-containing protein [Dermatobacter hominis]|uniref:PKD domain-containing protein n=1 Tax=Dermatobacter hominis TaxID=2884263 RepID=UPI001D0FD3A7|nr:PKD domain-containing protein [Dermatobacter hominis]UDY34892.1 PKD domain-containing protein [Dermatobacter hominis]